jgi:S-formylglutathione hydrolase FrmB
MQVRYRHALAALLLAFLVGPLAARPDATPVRRVFHVTLGGASATPVSGRLLLFATLTKDAQTAAGGGKVTKVDANPLAPRQVAIAAREVTHLEPGQTLDIDADAIAFPSGFSQLPAGDYDVQAVLDVDHSYNYTGRSAGDLTSDVVPMRLSTTGSDTPALTLKNVVPARDPWDFAASPNKELAGIAPEAKLHATAIDFVSPALSQYWGRPIHMKAWVLTPPDYKPGASTRYPTVYETHGFGGNFDRFVGSLVNVYAATRKGEMPPMIWVFLDESSATGTHEFADSVNNGPWGQALTTELIPNLEASYRMDGKVNGRFLNGHSSGGWATLWLQTRYPKVFGGTWSTSPDPSDFHDFTGTDLYAAHANVYRNDDGSARPLVRDKGKVLATFEEFAKMERVLGAYGGQMSSFDWVFSPRAADGRPMPMFDRDTGAVDPFVVAYWRDHYDIAYRLQNHWPELKGDLDDKIHLYVGTADTFYLDGAAHKLQAVLDGLHAKSQFTFIEGRTHFDLYAEAGDRNALLKTISWEMYKVARPGSTQPAR